VDVVQTFAAADVCCASFPAGCRCRAASNCMSGLQSDCDTIRGCSSALPGGRSVVGASVPRAEGAVTGAMGTVPKTGATVRGAGVVPLSCESLHPAGQLCNALCELGIVGWLADARESRPGDGLSYSVSTAGRSVKFNIRLGGEGGLHVRGS
jgi:hypothetical protein